MKSRRSPTLGNDCRAGRGEVNDRNLPHWFPAANVIAEHRSGLFSYGQHRRLNAWLRKGYVRGWSPIYDCKEGLQSLKALTARPSSKAKCLSCQNWRSDSVTFGTCTAAPSLVPLLKVEHMRTHCMAGILWKDTKASCVSCARQRLCTECSQISRELLLDVSAPWAIQECQL